ncbi:RNA methyltransferase [Caenispirillum salinarum]|uniref:RNA methyltransferase n=1 Tax=Caenispirillum salinarum TaxID=859058 RepID=UPI0038510A93
MAGTDKTRARELAEDPLAPVIILDRPQLGENVGTAARAMLNCGLTQMRLVQPREDHLSEKAISASSGAVDVLQQARVFDSLEEAVGDLKRVYATTARRRGMIKPLMTPKRAAVDMHAQGQAGNATGILFGKERTGLENDALALSDVIVEAPLNPAYCSLNLAMAVLLIGYEWYQVKVDPPAEQLITNQTNLAGKEMVLRFFGHLEAELDASGFLRVADKRPSMVRNIRNLFLRANLTETEIRTLHGIVKELRWGRRPDRPPYQGSQQPAEVGEEALSGGTGQGTDDKGE